MALASELLPLLPICLMRTVQSRESFVSTKSESNVNAYSIYIYCVCDAHTDSKYHGDDRHPVGEKHCEHCSQRSSIKAPINYASDAGCFTDVSLVFY